MWTTTITAEELAHVIDRCVVVDCRHDLADPPAGRRAFEAGHVPGAFFLSMDDELSGPKDGRNGRHPLPDRDALRARLEATGLSDGTQLVAYDGHGGMYAVRLWWLARWLGHEAVAVLDGGLDAWTRAGYPLSREAATPRAPGRLSHRPSRVRAVDADAVARSLADGSAMVLDARAPARYAGEQEPFDPVAGHIPGAVNRPFQMNLRPDGRFKPAPALRAEFDALLAGRAPDTVIQQCGSGITAVHNMLAMELAGLPGSALYPGSWSEWCADPSRPVATGPTP